ncbi:hypothetical protein ABZ946_22535 [Streptomyces sp. NPDC046324]|uniref:hypothetical protein n=1 Tax=Streptomyces sp. NPDC046324 TaxID=3154915 RepID=UPI0034114D82
MRRRGTGFGAALLAGGLALTGCGIQQSDVVEAGGPATVAVAPGEGSRLLLFYVDVDGRLTPAARPMEPPFDYDYQSVPGQGPLTYPIGTGAIASKALAALLRGPNAAERAAGLASRLPEPGRWADGKAGPLVNVEGEDGDEEPTLRVSLDFPLGDLDGTAVRQLVCTAAYAEETDARIAVVLSGPGGTRPAERCDEFEVGTPAPSETVTPTDTETSPGGGPSPTTPGDLFGTGGGAGSPGPTGTAERHPSPTRTNTP